MTAAEQLGNGLDWAYLRAHPHNLDRLIEHQRIRTTPLPGGDTCTAQRLTMDDGSSVFAKSVRGGTAAPAGFFGAEAAGLRWLAEAVPVPEVVAVTDSMLLLSWVESGPPSAAAAETLGRQLAAMHRCGAPTFGAAWPGWIGPLALDNSASTGWPDFYADQRVRPYLRLARDRGAMTAGQVAAVEHVLTRLDTLGVPTEAPSRLHGDLWLGNVLWSTDGRAFLVDPAAHGGHRETDLAMLALFGLPHLDRVLAAYDEAWPLAAGWQQRVALHQLHPLAVHAALFGGGYAARSAAAAQVYR
ncbi:MAG: fructosamine kinase family protein [Geodermatophilaceae bacterium]